MNRAQAAGRSSARPRGDCRRPVVGRRSGCGPSFLLLALLRRSVSDPPRRPPITVHVAGHVTKPGLVELPEGSRVADAVAAAGGLLPGARADLINLAALVVDGQQIVVSGPGGDSTSPAGRRCRARKVHLNLATAADLDALPGVGPVIADRIVSYREENGPFEAVEDLLDVPGIGEAKLADLRDHVQVP